MIRLTSITASKLSPILPFLCKLPFLIFPDFLSHCFSMKKRICSLSPFLCLCLCLSLSHTHTQMYAYAYIIEHYVTECMYVQVYLCAFWG